MFLVPIILPQFAGKKKRVMKCQPLVDWWLDCRKPTGQLPSTTPQGLKATSSSWGPELHFHDGRKSSQKFNRPKMAILKRIFTFSKLIIIIFSSHVVFGFRGWKTFPQAWQPPQPPGNPQSHSLPRCVDSSYPKFPSRIVQDRRGGR